MPVRKMPQNLEAEMSVLGVAFLDNKDSISKICEELTPDMFYSDQNKKIFDSNKRTMTEELNSIPQKLTILASRIKKLNKDIEIKHEYYDNAKIMAKQKEELESEIYFKINQNLLSSEEVLIGKYKGFNLIVPTGVRVNDFRVIVKGEGEYYVELGTDKTVFLDKINKLINSFDDILINLINEKKKSERDIPELRAKIKEEFADEKRPEHNGCNGVAGRYYPGIAETGDPAVCP